MLGKMQCRSEEAALYFAAHISNLLALQDFMILQSLANLVQGDPFLFVAVLEDQISYFALCKCENSDPQSGGTQLPAADKHSCPL